MVPGNHDVNRSPVTPMQTDWLDNRKDPDEICKLMEGEVSGWQQYMERLADYRDFLTCKGYKHLIGSPKHLIYGVRCTINGVKVGIGGFNLVWSCCRDSDKEKGKLWMGSHWQTEWMHGKLGSLGQDAVTIALMHHPPSWLVEPEDGPFWRALERDFRFFLHGHEHQGWVQGFDTGATRIAAGACYQRSDKENGYNMVRLDLAAGTGEVWLRSYEPKGGGWVPAQGYGQIDDRGVRTLRLDWLASGSASKPQAPRVDAEEVWFERVRQEYCASLQTELRDHIIRGFAPQVSGRVLSLPIAEVFLPLQAVQGRPALAEYAERDLHLEAERELAGELDWQRRQVEVEKHWARLSARQAAQRRLRLAELLAEPRSVLLGDPGTGKTTTTRYVTYALAAGDTTHAGTSVRGLIPLLIRIANYARAYEQEPTLHLVDYAEHKLMAQPEHGRFLRRAIEMGRCLIILDGLDEVGDVDLRIRVTERIRKLVAAYAGNRFMVTSRIIGYDRSPLTSDFTHATLQELQQPDRERFVRLWYDAIASEVSDVPAGGADNLVEALRARPQIARMAANPLLLTIIVLMHWRGVKLPSRRIQVYQNATDTLIEYWTAQRGVEELDAEEVKGILAPIAHHILGSNVAGVIAHADLLPRFHAGIVRERACDQKQAARIGRDMLRNLNEQSGLFLERGVDADDQPVYGFLHQTFGEYLAGLCLAEEMQRGDFDLARYIHRSIWHEPLLLMAGHLSLSSRHQANQLVREILEHIGPFEEILQRSALLAAECLADDVQVTSDLRDKVLGKLAQLIDHVAPQVQEAAADLFKRLGVTRHRDTAAAMLRQTYLGKDPEAQQLSDESRLNLATALIGLRSREDARPILQLLETDTDSNISTGSRYLRLEGWPEEAGSYLLQELQVGSITVGEDLESSYVCHVNANHLKQAIGQSGLLAAINGLLNRLGRDEVALQWIAAVAPSEEPDAKTLSGFLKVGTPVDIRVWASSRLLGTELHDNAVAVLEEIAEGQQTQKADEALLKSGLGGDEHLQFLQDIALISDGYQSTTAIITLLETGHEDVGLPAALHLLMNNASHLIEVMNGLLGCTATRKVGIAAARWLALRPGNRLKACEALLEEDLDEESILLLQYLAVESHDEEGQQACHRLMMLRESERVAPILNSVAQRGKPRLRYQASLSLAMAGMTSLAEPHETPGRIELKLSILDQRMEAERAAFWNLCRVAEEALAEICTQSDRAREAGAIGRLSLMILSQAEQAQLEQNTAWAVVSASKWPAIVLCTALFELRCGNVAEAGCRLKELLQSQPQSLPVRLRVVQAVSGIPGADTMGALVAALEDAETEVRKYVVELLGRTGDPATKYAVVNSLRDEASSVREAATEAMCAIGDSDTLRALLLSDHSIDVRCRAAEALGRLGGPSSLQALVDSLSSEDSNIRSSCATALGDIGDQSALQPLIDALGDEDIGVRAAAASSLGQLGDRSALQPLVAALSDGASIVRKEAASALGELDDQSATADLIISLGDKDRRVRRMVAVALSKLGDAVLQPLLTALTEKGSSVSRSAAAKALGMLGASAAIRPLIVALGDGGMDVRCSAMEALGELGCQSQLHVFTAALSNERNRIRRSAAVALGKLGDPSALNHLISALGDEDVVVRRTAAKALGELGVQQALRPLITVLTDSDYFLQSDAANSLGELGNRSAIPYLIVSINDMQFYHSAI